MHITEPPDDDDEVEPAGAVGEPEWVRWCSPAAQAVQRGGARVAARRNQKTNAGTRALRTVARVRVGAALVVEGGAEQLGQQLQAEILEAGRRAVPQLHEPHARMERLTAAADASRALGCSGRSGTTGSTSGSLKEV